MLVLKNIIRSIGQIISIYLFALACISSFKFKLSKHRIYTDDDAIGFVLEYGIIIFFGIGLFLNSIYYIKQNHWKKIRICVLVFVVSLSISIIIPREFIIETSLGEKKSEYEGYYNPDMIWTKLELYEDHNFLFSSSYGGEITIESVGKYEVIDNSMYLSFKSKKTKRIEYYKKLEENIGTSYKILSDTLFCIDCESEIKLKKTKPNTGSRYTSH